jgi:hypothetical protein
VCGVFVRIGGCGIVVVCFGVRGGGFWFVWCEYGGLGWVWGGGLCWLVWWWGVSDWSCDG